MMASTRLICFSSTLSAAFCRPENGPMLGIMPIRLLIDPIFYVLQLVAEVFEREAIAGEGLGGHLLRLLLVDLRFGALDQRENVAHAENARHNAIGMKRLERIVLLAHADELDWLPGNLPDGKRRAAAGVAIHLGEDDAGERKLFVELIGGAHGVLPGHGIGNEQNL